jgi:hypothetical protein
MAQTRDEQVVAGIIKTGSQQQKDAAMRYLQSVSARAEADIVESSNIAQKKIVSAINHMRATQLRNYDTQSVKKSISSILGKLVADIEVLTRRMISANILLGKIRAIAMVVVSGDALLKAITLNETDWQRVDSITKDSVTRIRHGADLTFASVSDLIQRAAIRSNMPHAGEVKSETKEANSIAQEPLSGEALGTAVDDRSASVIFRERPLSREEMAQLQANPFLFVSNVVKANTADIQRMRNAYFAEQKAKAEVSKDKPQTKLAFARSELNSIAQSMQTDGVSAFTDKGGKHWSLINYCSMTARTTSTTSSNVGDVFADSEHDLYYIVPHSHSCPLCAKVEGKVYSRSGTDPNYPPLASVFPKIDPAGTNDLNNTYMTIHPNCRHKIIKYVEQKKKQVSRGVVKNSIKK